MSVLINVVTLYNYFQTYSLTTKLARGNSRVSPLKIRLKIQYAIVQKKFSGYNSLSIRRKK